jgi:hypothetical protein
MARTVTVRTGGIGIDTSDFRAAARALRKAQPKVALELRKQLRVAGQIVADDAKQEIAKVSTRIPPTVKVRISLTSVSVVAGGGGVPTAGLFELGNHGGRKSAAASRAGRFRHPVHGNRQAWVNQPMHPFLAPAAQRNALKLDAAVTRALDAAMRTIALDGV